MSEPVSKEKIDELVVLLMERERRDAARKPKNIYTPLSERRNPELSWFFQETQAYNRQQRCNHLKGGRTRSYCSAMDYNVAMHTFPTGETKIWCLSNCGWSVWNRPGWSFKWQIGLDMVENSTNFPSSSEVSAKMLAGKQAVPVRTGGQSLRTAFYKDRK